MMNNLGLDEETMALKWDPNTIPAIFPNVYPIPTYAMHDCTLSKALPAIAAPADEPIRTHDRFRLLETQAHAAITSFISDEHVKVDDPVESWTPRRLNVRDSRPKSFARTRAIGAVFACDPPSMPQGWTSTQTRSDLRIPLGAKWYPERPILGSRDGKQIFLIPLILLLCTVSDNTKY